MSLGERPPNFNDDEPEILVQEALGQPSDGTQTGSPEPTDTIKSPSDVDMTDLRSGVYEVQDDGKEVQILPGKWG